LRISQLRRGLIARALARSDLLPPRLAQRAGAAHEPEQSARARRQMIAKPALTFKPPQLRHQSEE
jgi:hypothetical protein